MIKPIKKVPPFFGQYDIKIYADIMTNPADNLIFYIKTNNCEETNILGDQSVDFRTFFPI